MRRCTWTSSSCCPRPVTAVEVARSLLLVVNGVETRRGRRPGRARATQWLHDEDEGGVWRCGTAMSWRRAWAWCSSWDDEARPGLTGVDVAAGLEQGRRGVKAPWWPWRVVVIAATPAGRAARSGWRRRLAKRRPGGRDKAVAASWRGDDGSGRHGVGMELARRGELDGCAGLVAERGGAVLLRRDGEEQGRAAPAARLRSWGVVRSVDGGGAGETKKGAAAGKWTRARRLHRFIRGG